jgi:hypothetical protein
MSGSNHNLQIQNYSFDELLGLFELESYQISVDDLKRAKKKVLMLHPDKSRLDAKYFLFYKKAFDIVVQFYNNQHKQNQQVTAENSQYNNIVNEHNKATAEKISNTVQKMGASNFHDKFNQLFEQNQMAERPDPEKNAWFSQEKSSYDIPQGNVSSKNMGQAFDTIKQQSSGLIRHQGVQDMFSHSGAGSSSLYGGDDDGSYVTSDPFSKLKFDDLRKVHKDETVFAVSENDFQNVQTYGSVDEFNRARSQYSYDPMEKEKADRILQEQERLTREKMMQKEYQAKLQSQKYEEKNKSVLASFLQLRDWKA